MLMFLLAAHDVNGHTEYDYVVPTDVTYNLFEVDFVAKHKILNRFNNLEFQIYFFKIHCDS